MHTTKKAVLRRAIASGCTSRGCCIRIEASTKQTTGWSPSIPKATHLRLQERYM